MRRFFKRKADWGRCHPLVRQLSDIQREQQLAWVDVAERSGVAPATIRQWRCANGPRLKNFEAVLNTLGYELVIRERD